MIQRPAGDSEMSPRPVRIAVSDLDAISFNVPYVTGRERRYIEEVFQSGHFAGNGPFTKRCQAFLGKHLGAQRVLLTHSCTAGLEMSAMLYDLGPGDEVIMPSFTFVTTASAVMRTGATPVFCEVDEATMNIDLADAERRITSATKAIVPVHYAGVAPPMAELMEMADAHGLKVFEDAAQGLGATWQGQRLGTFAPLAAISFHETKNIHCGLGGCLVINDAELADRAEIIWERGTNRAAFFKGLVDKYSWVAVGSSFYPSELQAAFLLAQLEALEDNLTRRRAVWDRYAEGLADLHASGAIQVLLPPEGAVTNAHLFGILLPTPDAADATRKSLNAAGIQATIHYVPLHVSGMGEKLGYTAESLPRTDTLASRLLRLPLHDALTHPQVDRVIQGVHEAVA